MGARPLLEAGPVALDRTGGARTSAQAVWARAEREARRARERSTSRQ